MIDAHMHIWRIGQNGHEWPGPDLPAIYRDFLFGDLDAPADLDGVVLVQSQPSDDDTAWMLEQAAQNPRILGVVGWTDLAAPDARTRIDGLTRHPKLRGLRPMLQGLNDDAWILRPDVESALEAMIAHDLAFDALIFPRHLPHIAELARRWPDLRIVIDHGAKPQISQPDAAPVWRDAIAAVAQHPNVACKLSGLITEAAPGAPLDAVQPYADHLLTVFGAERLIWGSDWPVLTQRCGWRDWRGWTQGWLADKPAAARAAILGGAAERLYALHRMPA
ncbi:MAG TPA: amidohydrolase family protein [Asticcacaulis sp.]|nr:amidohydrolase family protein [Asticcacaulis sp.]